MVPREWRYLLLVTVLLLCGLPSVNGETPEFLIESCLADKGNLSQVLSHKLAAITEIMRLSVQQRAPAPCAAACSSLGFHHAGIRNDYECWCGEETRFTAEANCTKCQGNATQLCGGPGVMALYDLGDVWAKFKYNGCFRYDTPQQIASILPHTQWTTTEAAHWSHHLRQPAVCVKWCLDKGYRFAGWTQYYECHCGGFVPDVTEANCDPCFADRRFLCGGLKQIAIYEVVQDPPRAALCGGQNHTAVAGYPTSLRCTATGDHPIVLAWHRVRGDVRKPLGDGSHILEVTGDLVIHEVEDADEGLYACEASNENMLSKLQRSHVQIARLKVQVPPGVTLQLDNNGKALYFGKTATLRCQVKGDAPIVVQWFFKGKRLDPTASAKHSIRNKIGSAVVSLEIFDISKRDLGLYECEATNPKIVLPQARVRKSSLDLTAVDSVIMVPVTNPASEGTEQPSSIVVQQSGVGLSVGVLVLILLQCFVIMAVLGLYLFQRYKRCVEQEDLYDGATVKANPMVVEKCNISPPLHLTQEPGPTRPTPNNDLRRAVVYMDDMDDALPSPPPGATGPNPYFPNHSLPRNGHLSPASLPSRSNSRWSLNSNTQMQTLNTHQLSSQDFYSVPPDHRLSRSSLSREAGV